MGSIKTFEAYQASGTSTSSYIDLGNINSDQLAIKYTTMSTGASVDIYGCDATTIASASSGTYYPVMIWLLGSFSIPAWDTMAVTSSVSGGRWAHFENPPFRFIKFVTTDVVSGGVSYTVVAKGRV
jgi:hypothetical protein